MFYLCFLYILFAIVLLVCLDLMNSFMNHRFSKYYEVYALMLTCGVLCVWSLFLIDDELRERNEREERDRERVDSREYTPENNPYHIEQNVV